MSKESTHRILNNICSLSVLNGLNILLPLLILPYILRVIGAANYGSYSYIYILIQYLLLISNYGFNYTATKQISESRDDIKKLNKIFNSVIFSRFILFFISLIFFLLLSPLLFNSNNDKIMFFMGLGIIVGDILTPLWLFQGLEEMRYITIVSSISKIIFNLFVVIFITRESLYIYIMLFNSMGYILSGFIGSIIAIKRYGIRYHIPLLSDIKFQLLDGLSLFGSTACMTLYRNSNIFLLKFFVDEYALGVYAAAEKIIKGLQLLTSPISQALFPSISYKFKNMNLSDKKDLLRHISFLFGIVLLFLTAMTFFFSNTIVTIICGLKYIKASLLLKIMSFVIFFGGLNYILGIVGLVNLNKQKQFFYGVMISGLISISIMLTTVSLWGTVAAAVAMTSSEVILFVLSVYYILNIKQVVRQV